MHALCSARCDRKFIRVGELAFRYARAHFLLKGLETTRARWILFHSLTACWADSAFLIETSRVHFYFLVSDRQTRSGLTYLSSKSAGFPPPQVIFEGIRKPSTERGTKDFETDPLQTPPFVGLVNLKEQQYGIKRQAALLNLDRGRLVEYSDESVQ